MSHQKIYILDTNMLVYNPNVVDELGDNVIVIPFWVLEELDNLKRSKPQLAYAVRNVSRRLEYYRLKGVAEGHSLLKGIPTDNGGSLVFDHNAMDLKGLGFPVADTVDNRVLLVAKHWQDQETKGNTGRIDSTPRPVIVLSKDTFVRIKASAAGILAEDWQSDRLVQRVENIYSGMMTIPLRDEQAMQLSAKFSTGRIPIDELGLDMVALDVMPNMCVTLTWSDDKHALAIYKKADRQLVLVKKPGPREDDWREKVRPINPEQAFAYSMLKDPTIQLVSLMGIAGTGKTLMALLAGYDQVKAGKYKRILVWRSTQIVGERDLGYYPGTLEEKFAPYARPVLRAFQKAVGPEDKGVEIDYEKGLVTSKFFSIEPILHIQGSTEEDTFLIIDEVQNLTPNEMKAILTRAGVGTKVVLTGDVEQVTNRFLDAISNGLTFTVERWRDSERAGHVTLFRSERSELVEEATQRMC